MVTYVGNRCIMTPEGIWSSSKSYEALSVVSHQPTGDGYVSRRAVPTGIDISDDTYWVKMTDFNTQLSTIQAGVEKAEEDAAEALAGVNDKISKTKIIVTKEALLALLENGYVVDAALIRQLYNELNGKTEEIETELSGITTFQDFSQSGVVINPNSVKEVQINIAKEGYSPIATEAITIGSGNAIDKYFINSSNMLMVLVRNMESSQHTNDMSFRVRYIKNFAGGS